MSLFDLVCQWDVEYETALINFSASKVQGFTVEIVLNV